MELNVITGTNGNDRLTGTEEADLINSLGGSYDVITGLAGADVFDFTTTSANGGASADA